MTTIFHIDNSGEINELASYSLEPKEALKVAYLQNIVKTFNTWNYDKLKTPSIKEGKRGYSLFFGDNEVYYAKKEVTA